MYDRFLTNSAGGNVSCRVDGKIYISPRYAGAHYRWRLEPAQILVFNADMECIGGDPTLVSRESAMHFETYRHFPEVNGICHAHPRYLDAFIFDGRPLTPTNQYTARYGEAIIVPNIKAESKELAEGVVAALRPHRERLQSFGLGLLLTYHGVTCVGKDLDEAFETLECMEWAAHTLLMRKLLA
jgi:L-fuculose-phosphate aldolase